LMVFLNYLKIGYMYLDDSFVHLKGIQWSYI
jgi:hypothetical protein